MAIGDLVAIDSLEFDTSKGTRVSFIHVTGNIYAVSYIGPDSDGWLKTFAIDSEGNIGSVIDSLEFAPATTIYQSEIRHVSGDIYAIAYADDDANEGRIVTVEIDSAGYITDILVDGPNAFSAAIQNDLDFIKVADGMFACLYSTDGFDAFICTIGIANDGTIDAAITDFLEFDTGLGNGFNITHIAGDFFAVVYEGFGTGDPLRDSLMLKTVEISSAGVIPAAVTDSLELEQQRSIPFPSICLVSGDIYAIAYTGAGGDGWLKTVSIDSGGSIGAVIDTREFEADACYNPSLAHVAGDLFAVAYERSGDFGRISTIEIDSAGTIGTILDSLSFGTGLFSHAHWPRLVVIETEVLAVAYYDYYSDGRVGTIGIESIVAPTVTTDPATLVEATAATPNGTLEDDGGEACDVRFQYGETSAYGIDTEWQSGKESVVAFEQAIASLSPKKTYHFRAQARNSAGTVNGADRTFTTLVAIPTVTTDAATGLAAVSATPNGTLNQDGGEACECGFEWGLDTGYGVITPTEKKTTGEAFSQVIGGLFPNTTYHFRAFATNSVGTSYGDDRSFTTALVISRAFALAREEL